MEIKGMAQHATQLSPENTKHTNYYMTNQLYLAT